jgi:hypothetical protein
MIPPNRLVIASISTGLETYQKPFLIDNTAFPTLENALCFRKRLIKKPGSGQIPSTRGFQSRLQRVITSTVSNPIMTLNGAGSGSSNLISVFSLQSTSAIVPGSISFTDGTNTFTEPSPPNGTLIGVPGGSGTINYATGAVTIAGGAAGQMVTGAFSYYPGLPVMGIESFESDAMASSQIDFPISLFFDTVYSYQYNGVNFIDNSFYKSTGAPITWSGQNFQQFFSSNYFRVMFVTNNKPGAQFGSITAITPGSPTKITTAFAHNLTNSDYVFINEVAGDVSPPKLNMQCFKVMVVDAMNFNVDASTAGAPSGGIFQYLTSKAPVGGTNTGDGIQWYDGLSGGLGFVNFMPPLDNLSTNMTTYLIGARMIIPFGNRLLAIGTFEATSSTLSTPIYYGNRIRFCQVIGSPFYTNGQTIQDNLLPISLVPLANPGASNSFVANESWVSNIQGFGGFIDLDTTERIISAAVTQGSMILGLESEQRRVSNTGIETDPFSIQLINPDYGTAGTHAVVSMDKGILSVGEYGFIITSSYDSKRFDLPIIDQIFQINANNNGFERICGERDFPNEVLYFTYPSIDGTDVFPDRTLVYNYRENNFALWQENATTYGIYKIANITWSALTDFTWEQWDEIWSSGNETDIYPYAAFGTPQGFVLLKWFNDSKNDPSLLINAITGNQITSTSHNLETGMYLGIVPIGSYIPSTIGQVVTIVDTNNFILDNVTGIVPGLSTLSIIDQPFIQTKQFQLAWSDNKKVRIGAQKYFMDTTFNGEFTVDILGSQSNIPLNDNTTSNPLPSLISNAIVRTRPDDSLGLNDNAAAQTQIWHRLASTAIGDTIQLQFTFSDSQMRNVDIATSPWVLHAAVLDLYPSRILA